MKLHFVQLGATMMKFSLAKGVNTLYTVPAGMRCWLYLAGGTYIADATVATRTFRVISDTGAATVQTVLLAGTILASEQKYFTLGAGITNGGHYSGALPPGGLPLGEGHRITVGVVNEEVGDTWEIDLLMYYAYVE